MGHSNYHLNPLTLAVALALAAVPSSWAGDILRGGTSAAPATNAPTATTGASTAQAAKAQANAADALARTTAAINSVKAMQVAARKAAIAGPNNLGKNPNFPGQILPNVPNGLVIGGLQVAPGVPANLSAPTSTENPNLWVGAKLPTQTVSGGKTKVTIVQTQSQALLNWETFNVGKRTAVNFNQTAGKADASKWIAFNKINDPTGNPTQILGSLDAVGQVYLINQNGIIFGGSTQVNAHNLTASSLPINDNLISRGLLNNPDSQFLFTALPQNAGNNGTPAFTPPAASTPDGTRGDVIVRAGAQLSSPTSADNVGGRIALIGPNVSNEGTISTPDGQTILAAGLQVGFSAHSSSDPSLRGLDVYVGAINSTSGTASNTGLLDVPRASSIITGKNVNQLGVIQSSTSVSLNGRIDLLANYNSISNIAYDQTNSNSAPFLFQSTGIVTSGVNSINEILPEYESAEKVIGTRLALPSQINIQGLAVNIGKNASFLAPNGTLIAKAGVWDYIPSAIRPISEFVFAGGQIYIDSGASLNVAGSVDVSAPISQNILNLQLRGAELSDSPVQRTGPIRGPAINVDVRKSGEYNGRTWIGTPLGDVSGYAGLIQRNVGELTTTGGMVNLQTGGSVVIQKGATVDVSGGWINYVGEIVQTTRVISDGRLLDISQATPDLVYSGIYNGTSTISYSKYGISETYSQPLGLTGAHFENGYKQGADAGTLNITSASLALDGSIIGKTVTGSLQIRNQASGSSLPKSGTLAITFQAQQLTPQQVYPLYSPTPPKVIFAEAANQNPVGAFSLDSSGSPIPIETSRLKTVYLSSSLIQENGFANFSLTNVDGDIIIPNDAFIEIPALGSFALAGANVTVEGRVSAPGGAIQISTFNISPSIAEALFRTIGAPLPNANSDRGLFTLGDRAALSTAGLLVSDLPQAKETFSKPISIDGGSIIVDTFSGYFSRGGLLDVSGGAYAGPTGTITYGDGGNLSIITGQDKSLKSVLGGTLRLDSPIRGFSGARGGSLTIQAQIVRIGGMGSTNGDFSLAPEFFGQGGFAEFNIVGLGASTGKADVYIPAIVIEKGVNIEPIASGYLATANNVGEVGIQLDPYVYPSGLRSPVSINFTANGVQNDLSGQLDVRGDFVMDAGATIQTDPLGKFSVNAQTALILGNVMVPGGTITINAGLKFPSANLTPLNALTTLVIGPKAVLSAAGTTLLTPNSFGYRTGQILSGGTIQLSGNIFTADGAVIDVSGSSDVLDLPPNALVFSEGGDLTYSISANSGITQPLYNVNAIRTVVDSNGGTISMKGGEELFSNATLLGKAGGGTALGGNLSVSSGRFYLADTARTSADVNLIVNQRDASLPFVRVGETVVNSLGDVLPQIGYFRADSFRLGGFDSLALGGNVQFSGKVSISAAQSLTVATGGIISADSSVLLRAPHISIGQAFAGPLNPLDQAPFYFTQTSAQGVTTQYNFLPTHGSGNIKFVGSLIDVGVASFQNIGAAIFDAGNGDIRGDGTLDVAGDIHLRAGQIYPATAVTFTIAAYDYKMGDVGKSGSVTIAPAGDRQIPYSAGGQLNIYGATIKQGGALRAPLGIINIGWDGFGDAPAGLISHQPVAVTRQLTLGAESITSVSAFDSITNKEVILPYGISPDGTSWIDPQGTDITGGTVPQKNVSLGSQKITTKSGSSVNIGGGGNLYAYRWVSGQGGTRDILSANTSFAIIPGYQANFSPYAKFSNSSFASALNNDPGYVNSTLSVGDLVHLGASDDLPEGDYTLLPARYALLPGAYLITPKSGRTLGLASLPDGSKMVQGYRFNSLNDERRLPKFASTFEIASASVVRSRAQYDDYLANSFLRDRAAALNIDVPRLPVDSGRLILQASQTIVLNGGVTAEAPLGGRGGLIDISSPSDIEIVGTGTKPTDGALTLQASVLNKFGAESLLIGGTRVFGNHGTSVTVDTGNLTVSNAGTPLLGAEIILVANQSLTVSSNSVIRQAGNIAGSADTLFLGDSGVAGSGDGVLLRVNSDPSSQIVRLGVSDATAPSMTIGSNVQIAGASVTLDSTSGTALDPSASIKGQSINLNSGQITIILNQAGGVPETAGLKLSGQALEGLQSATSLSLLSYSSLDIYGSGSVGSAELKNLALHTGEIRGFNNTGTTTFTAANILLDNSTGTSVVAGIPSTPEVGSNLIFNAAKIRLSTGQLAINQFATVSLVSNQGVLVSNNGGLAIQQDLGIAAAGIGAAAGADYIISAGGEVNVKNGINGKALGASGLGAQLTVVGDSITVNSDVSLPSGNLTLHATGGDLIIGNLATSILEVSGTAQVFQDLIRFTNAGTLNLRSDTGSVIVGAKGTVSVAGNYQGGNAGVLNVSAPKGNFTPDGTLLGQGGRNGDAGSFSLDVGSLGSIANLAQLLDTGDFHESRSYRVRAGDVSINGDIRVNSYSLTADNGSILVTGSIDTSGNTGGSIFLAASGSITLDDGSLLSAAGKVFDKAGKGGSISLEAGSEIDGFYDPTAFLNIQSGSTINLSVASQSDTSALYGQYSGKLHLRAPQTTSGSDYVQINSILGNIVGASSIEVEGYQIFDLTNSSGSAITTTVQNNIKLNGNAFAGHSTEITNRLFGSGSALEPLVVITPGAEIINRAGSLTLASDWDLSTYRFGTKLAPGVLTIRSFGNLVFNGSLSDGFNPAAAPTGTAANLRLWLAPIMAQNSLLPINTQSWSYRLTSGADFSGGNYADVQSSVNLAANTGSLKLGKNGGQAFITGGTNAKTSTLIPTLYQVIRTGTGDIDIHSARDVQLLNQFATIYSAGVSVPNPTSVFASGDFQVPIVNKAVAQGSLGTTQQLYGAQYSLAGGNVSISATNDIIHLTMNNSGALIDDSERQLPTNWLYRRGYVDPITGQFGTSGTGNAILGVVDPNSSTTWWIDFSNFFEGVGALGGGNVSLIAGHDVKNVDAVIPTNARMPKGTPDNAKLLELGGGDLVVRAGNNIDAGAYYVERGNGILRAGNEVTTNSTRSPSLGILQSLSSPVIYDSSSWLPTTLFVGKSSFDVSAKRDLLLGPVVNPFLLPQGQGNEFYYKTYFSTYDPADVVTVSSLSGNVNLRSSTVLPLETVSRSILGIWLQTQQQLSTSGAVSSSFYQPWLRLAETLVSPFESVFSLMAPTLEVTALSGDVNLAGNFRLFPSPTGTLEILAAGNINGLRPSGISRTIIQGASTTVWSSSTINLSDADPDSLPHISTPYAYKLFIGAGNATSTGSVILGTNILATINVHLIETGSYQGNAASIEAKQALHAASILHANDSEPLRLYASNGDISGLTLYSPKRSEVIAGNDITDIGLYIQNVEASDSTMVTAGRDIVAYQANSILRIAAQATGNSVGNPNTGDIQISGPGTLEVLAGRNLDLGSGSNNLDGTGDGITSIGNARNPFLSFDGASIVAGAGIALPLGLASQDLAYDAFLGSILTGPNATRYLSELSDLIGSTISADTSALSDDERSQLALKLFYLALRDAGRDFNNPDSPSFGTYTDGLAAIAALFPPGATTGNITTQGRDIRTKNGGAINLIAPTGGLTLANSTLGNPLAPPGIVTESGGSVSIFTNDSVDIGIGRIFTLRGGDIVIWSSTGDIAAGSSAKTVQSAPPTRVLIDPQSADVQTDLAGLATGGGIGVLATVANVAPGDVDLLAPTGVVDAGDAGIRSSGNLNIAAVAILNANNITVAGTSAGVPTVVAPTVNLAGITQANTSTAAGAQTASDVAKQNQAQEQQQDVPSIITVEVLGYGGG